MVFQQPEHHFRETLEKTKPNYELREKVIEHPLKSHQNDYIIPKREIEPKKNKSVFVQSEDRSEDDSKLNKSERRKKEKGSCKSIKRRIYISGAKRRRSMMGYEKTSQGRRYKRNRN